MCIQITIKTMLFQAFFALCALGVLDASPLSGAPRIGRWNFSEMSLENREIMHPHRIIGGEAATPGEYTFPISLRLIYNAREYHICGGAVVNEQWVVTAAHCCQEGQTDYRVVAGAYNFENPLGDEQTRQVVKVIPHEKYDSHTIQNDICLLKVDTPFDLNGDSVSAIKLANTSIPPPDPATVIGWGTTDSGDLADILQTVDVPYVPNDVCADAYSNVNDIVPSMCCFGDMEEGGRDSCQGDSGGPLVGERNGEFVNYGIVSWGVGCAQAKYPGVYTRIPIFYDWVFATIKKYS